MVQMDDVLGQRNEGYRCGKHIGTGTFSRIYLGENAERKPVALKVIDRESSSEVEKVLCLSLGSHLARSCCHYSLTTQARREITVMQSCGSHPNLLQLLDTFENRSNLVLVLQLAEGDLCDQIMREGPMSEPEARHKLRMLIHGLGHLHEHGIRISNYDHRSPNVT